jgi:hypothetical protein
MHSTRLTVLAVLDLLDPSADVADDGVLPTQAKTTPGRTLHHPTAEVLDLVLPQVLPVVLLGRNDLIDEGQLH